MRTTAVQNLPASDWMRFAKAVGLSSLTMMVAAVMIWTCPTEGYRAGYDAVIAKGPGWVDGQVEAAGVALRACDSLRLQTETGSVVDYGEFIEGCSAGIDYLAGRHVPVIASGIIVPAIVGSLRTPERGSATP